MRTILFLCLIGCAGCSSNVLGLGKIVQHTVTCVDPEVCKADMYKNCPNGGALHSLQPAVEVVYSCNTN